ncbi:type IV secretion system DNA-binding domain-containing protein [Granulicella sp. dw_53]|uniref:type IV secretion system DNA-binding domain-containing protein n=1 Tax=Granulicella sp. dw_53 TaxID=2719792 RepID=UPI001BD6CB59|nr:type IV secretion system DNA-binding domain-containing protein [Granulicella sp. dw_53]
MAKTTWGRKETIIWPQHRPVYTYGAIFAAIVLTLLFLYGRLRLVGTPLQRFYIPVYVRTSIFGSFSKTHRSEYRMLFLAGRGNKPSPAINDDVVHGKTVEPGGRIIPLALSPSALQHGDDLLFRGPLRSYVDARLSDYLKVAIYKDGLSAIVKIPLLCGAGIFLILLPLAVTKDVKRQKALKYGRRLKGPEKLTPQEFNDVVKGDGVGFKTDGMKEMIRIPARAEAQHMQFIGDTGAGKSALMFQVLRQAQSRGDSAIVYDPAREFVKRFYDPSRGDVILNPLDKRCPYWGPAEELRSRSEAKALAVSLFQPPQDRKGEFFIESPQKIFAFLMAYGPTPDELVQWMSNPDEIDHRLKGTEHAHLIDPQAHQQRAGVLGSLGLVADSLRLLPKKAEGNGTWTASDWAEKRQGWIFLTSRAAEREALRPLQSLWIDWLVLRLLNEPTKGQKRVWFLIDELASLQKLPQLHTAITEGRKGQNPVVLGFQGKAQVEYLYGHLAEVMLSQPATSVWLTTKEPNAGEWVSKFIGKVEIERLRETHFDGTRAGRNFTMDRQVEPLVMESEISGLPDLHAFMKYQNYVTYFSFPYFDMPEIAKPFELRERPDDKLPYDPKNIRSGKPEPSSPELKQEPKPSAPTPTPNEPATSQAVQPELPLTTDVHEEQNVITHG